MNDNPNGQEGLQSAKVWLLKQLTYPTGRNRVNKIGVVTPLSKLS
jgi:hypothetical protein